MKRLTEWIGEGKDRKAVVKQDNVGGDKACAARLAIIEDILGDEYDLGQLHKLVSRAGEPLANELEEAIDELKCTGYQPNAFSRFEPFYEDGSEYKKAVDTVEDAIRKAYRCPPKEV